MIDQQQQLEDRQGNLNPINATLLTPSNLHLLPSLGDDHYLAIPEEHNAQPFLDDEAEYLYGPAGLAGFFNKTGPDGRGRVDEPVYGFWVDLGRGVVVGSRVMNCICSSSELI